MIKGNKFFNILIQNFQNIIKKILLKMKLKIKKYKIYLINY